MNDLAQEISKAQWKQWWDTPTAPQSNGTNRFMNHARAARLQSHCSANIRNGFMPAANSSIDTHHKSVKQPGPSSAS
jgi:hypothetical protein